MACPGSARHLANNVGAWQDEVGQTIRKCSSEHRCVFSRNKWRCFDQSQSLRFHRLGECPDAAFILVNPECRPFEPLQLQGRARRINETELLGAISYTSPL